MYFISYRLFSFYVKSVAMRSFSSSIWKYNEHNNKKRTNRRRAYCSPTVRRSYRSRCRHEKQCITTNVVPMGLCVRWLSCSTFHRPMWKLWYLELLLLWFFSPCLTNDMSLMSRVTFGINISYLRHWKCRACDAFKRMCWISKSYLNINALPV